jgi:hypothetical protein
MATKGWKRPFDDPIPWPRGNIIDCYCAIQSMWKPGDRIFFDGRIHSAVPCGAVDVRRANHHGAR